MAHVIGLTGGIASGKSTVARLLVARGAAVVDADLIARQVVEPGQPALAELVARFGAAILTAEGRLDRPRLGAIAFADPAARADLGKITHPRIAAASAAAIAAWADAGAGVVFYEAALLVENRAYAALSGLVVVAARPAVQESRTVARDGITLAEARARIAAQLPLADKIAVATWVVHNDAGEAELVAEVERVVGELEAQHGPIRVPPRAPPWAPADAAATAQTAERALVTGYPSAIARRLIAELLAAEPVTEVSVLARGSVAAEARVFLDALPGHAGRRAQVLVGDVSDMDLGLSSAEYRALTRELTWIHHLAAIDTPDAEVAHRVNVVGTRTVLDLARDCGRLARVAHWSTALVSGARGGTIYEEDLDAGQRFPTTFARTQYDAERLARAAMRQLPVTVLRPAVVVGDSATGELEPGAGPGELIARLARREAGARLPERPLHLVPIDYVVAAAWRCARGERAAGQTFHLVDPSPLSARAVGEAVARLASADRPPAARPGPLAQALRRLARGPTGTVQAARYDATNTARALAGTGVRCPALADYLPLLVRAALR